jgi:glycosyltransferase involved in cell wall biosynthesis
VGIKGLVNFQGSRGLAEVAAAMRSAHVLCLPSVRESGGAVLLEAMASARPVIAVAFGGPAEIVDASVGHAIPPSGVEGVITGLMRALRDIVDNPDAWRRRGEEGRRRAEARFSWDANVGRALDIYGSVVNLHDSAGATGGHLD